jgi:hypothetical protein
MREDLDKERKFMTRQWAKRESQILGVVESTAGMVGDLQGIAGKAMPEIPALDLPLIDGPQSKVETTNDERTPRSHLMPDGPLQSRYNPISLSLGGLFLFNSNFLGMKEFHRS